MITKLFEKSKKKADKTPASKKKAANSMIEVISSTLTEEEKIMEKDIFKKREAEEKVDLISPLKIGNYQYGFNQAYQGFFDDLEVS